MCFAQSKKIYVPPHQSMVPAIIEHLRQFGDLPKEGLLTGQAVSSAISELFGDGRAVAYNDLDIFLPYQGVASKNDEDYSAIADNIRDFMNKQAIAKVHHSALIVKQEYGFLCYDLERRYRLAKTEREGMLNRVYCTFKNSDYAADVIASFDLNCVQVGIQLETGKLIWSRHYEEFLRTGQLDIVNLSTPTQSIIRYFTKLKELEGLYGDSERLIELVAMSMQGTSQDGTFISSTSAMTTAFGDRYKKKFDGVESDLQPYFSLTSEKIHDINVYQLSPRFEVDKAALSTIRDLNLRHYHLPTLSKILHGKLRNAHKERLEHLLRIPAKKMRNAKHEENFRNATPYDTLVSYLWKHGESEFKSNMSCSEFDQLAKFLTEHTRMTRYFHDVKPLEQLNRLKQIRHQVRTRGKWVVGALEIRDHDSFECDHWTADYLNEILDDEERVQKSIQIAPILPSGVSEGYQLKELCNGIELLTEGSEMHHCVGGYGRMLVDGKSRIFSVRNAMTKSMLTLQIGRREQSKLHPWKIMQAHGPCNSTISDIEEEVVLKILFAVTVAEILGAKAVMLFGIDSRLIQLLGIAIRHAQNYLNPENMFGIKPNFIRTVFKQGIRLKCSVSRFIFGHNASVQPKAQLVAQYSDMDDDIPW